MFKLNLIQSISKWIMTVTSLFTMVMLPVAQGQAAQNESAVISKLQVQQAITQLGLNKSMTLGEFYKKNKYLYPPRVQAHLNEFINDNKDYTMPLFEVTSVKNSEGFEVPTVRVSKDGELVNMQINGNSNKYVKFNNTNLTEVDIINFSDMFLKLNNGDANLRKQTEAKFNGYPEISKEIWKSMSARDKAEYILNLRKLWSDAQKVLILKNSKSSAAVETSKLEYVFNSIFSNASAQQAKVAVKPAGAKTAVKKNSGSTVSASSENCIVAGYVSNYSNGSCGINAIQDSYKDESGNINPAVSKAQSQCGSGQIACNPFVYGLPGGKAICVTTSDPSFQIATHANGPCDTKSPLGTEVQFLNKDLKNQNRYSAENLKLNPDQLSEEYKKQQKQNSAYVENYLKGFLGAGIDLSKELDVSTLDQIVNIKKAFDSDIQKAKDSCIAAASSNKYNEKNFWGACDQLQRRFLFVAEFLKEKPGCKDGASINSETLKCTCTDSKKTEVNPGAKCAVKEDPKPETAAKCPKGLSDDSTGGSLQCLCENGASGNWTLEQAKSKDFSVEKSCAKTPQAPPGASTMSNDNSTKPQPNGSCLPTQERVVGESSGAVTCVDKATAKPPKKDDGGWFGSMSGFFSKALPWLVGGVAIYAMYKLWAPKKPALNSAGDFCSNGTRPPCGQVCTAPLSNVNGSCVCAACAPGQTLTNASTCTCSTTSTTTPTTVICPDGVTRAATLALCPATQYTCWDGSKVTNPINCPEKPATTTPATKTGH